MSKNHWESINEGRENPMKTYHSLHPGNFKGVTVKRSDGTDWYSDGEFWFSDDSPFVGHTLSVDDEELDYLRWELTVGEQVGYGRVPPPQLIPWGQPSLVMGVGYWVVGAGILVVGAAMGLVIWLF